MNDLIEFLRAQLDDDERVARAILASWMALTIHPDRGEVVTNPDADRVAVTPTHGLAEHIARWDPARVLAEVDAHRRLIDGLIEFMEGDYAPWNEDYLKLLALPHADRPGYREEWRR